MKVDELRSKIGALGRAVINVYEGMSQVLRDSRRESYAGKLSVGVRLPIDDSFIDCRLIDRSTETARTSYIESNCVVELQFVIDIIDALRKVEFLVVLRQPTTVDAIGSVGAVDGCLNRGSVRSSRSGRRRPPPFREYFLDR